MANGKLVVNAKNQIRVRFTNAKNVEVEMAVSDAELSAALRAVPLKELNGRDVELDVEKGQPRKVRPVGEAFAAPRPQPPAGGQRREQQGSRRPQGGGRLEPQGQKRPANQSPRPRPAFHNPYNFVPAPSRVVDHPELGDREPVGHHRYHADQVSGVIRVTMTLKTPLLLPDAGCAIEGANDHKTFPVRLDADGRPLVAPTGVKGMLRSAYEAVTNSRMAVFVAHEDRLGRRMNSEEGLGLIPCRIEDSHIRLLPGTSTITQGRPSGPMYAAWLPFDLLRQLRAASALPVHRDPVTCWIELWERTPWNRRERRFDRHRRFRYWKVVALGRMGASPSRPDPTAPVREVEGSNHHTPVSGEPLRQCDGYACMTQYNFDRKYNERVFFSADSGREEALEPAHGRLWSNLIRNYRTNDDLIRDSPRPSALHNAGWSLHMTDDHELELSDGSLAYALVTRRGAGWQVHELFPVSIARRLFSVSPEELLDESLQSAYWYDLLSPADRVFGWVRQSDERRARARPEVPPEIAKAKAYRGNVRVGPVTCTSEDDPVERFPGNGLPLAILGQPKEQQARFYVAKNQNGEAQDDGLTKESAGYTEFADQDRTIRKGLRGRKVYPHHASLPGDHWQEPQNDQRYRDVAESGQAREYLRHPDSRDGNGRPNRRDNQNRSIAGWVKPGTSFSFDLHVTNLSPVELGALLWLLKLREGHYHRLGGGKPLGFGSVRLEIDAANTTLHDGNGWKKFYGTLDTITPPVIDQTVGIKEFEAAVVAAYGAGAAFEDVPFIAAFLKMASGFVASRLPTHYPRAQHPPHPEGRAYEWFEENDRTGAQGGPRVCLRDLATDPRLPILPEQE